MVRPPQHVPTLTEVIELHPAEPLVGKTDSTVVVSSGFPNPTSDWAPIANVFVGQPVPQEALPSQTVPVAEFFAAPQPVSFEAEGVSEVEIAQRVLSDVQKQIDGLLDFRLRESLGPILARHSEALVRDLREELGRTMRDVVARSVAQEMAKLRRR